MMSRQNDNVSLTAPPVVAFSRWMEGTSSKNINQRNNVRVFPSDTWFREPERRTMTLNEILDDHDECEQQTTFLRRHVPADAEYSPQDIDADDTFAPCDCAGANMNLYSLGWYGNTPYAPNYYPWGRTFPEGKILDENTVLTNKGVVDRDECWCENNSPSCLPCTPINLALRKRIWTEQLQDYYIYGNDPFFKAIEENGRFTYGLFRIKKERRHDEWSDHFLCVKYFGVRNQPRTYHLVFGENVCVARNVTTGPFVPRAAFENSFTIEEKMNVVNHHRLPVVDKASTTVMPLGTAAAIAVSRLPFEQFDEVERALLLRLLPQYLEPFKSDNLYVLPFPGDYVTQESRDLHMLEQDAACNNLKPRLVTACGDEDTSVGERSIEQDHQQNVDLAESTAVSTTKVATEEFQILPWIKDVRHEYPDLTGRWTKAFSFQWTTSQTQGEIIQRYDLPIEAIQAFMNSPNALPWTQHAFYRADMEVKVQVNSQAAQSGYLAVGIMYNASEATAIGQRVDHVANIVQMPHVRISAGASNSGVIEIPYVRQFPVGCVLNNNFDYPQYICTMFVAPLLQLRTGPDGPQVVDVTIMLRFPRCEFYGQRVNIPVVTATGGECRWVPDLTTCGDVESNPGPFGAIFGAISTVAGIAGKVATVAGAVSSGLGSFGSAASGVTARAESMLRKVFPKKDMDRPQKVDEPVNLYLQQNTSLSLATGTNNVKLLQLQSENSVSHPPALVPHDEQFSNEFITTTFGMIDYFQWSTDSASGSLLYSIPVSPLRGFQRAALEFYPTPLGGLGTYYGGYYGEILVRLTFAISKFHSGRVYIVYSPDVVPNFADIGSYPGTLLDVQDQSQYTFVIPYQAPTPFVPLYSEPLGTTANFLAVQQGLIRGLTYGHLYIFVENQLRAMQTVSPTIDVLVEQAAAPGDRFAYVIPSGSQMRSIPTVTATGSEVGDEVPSQDERKQVESSSVDMRRTFPTWAVQLNENYDIRDLVKRYIPWFTVTSPSLMVATQNSQNATANMYTNVSVFHVPLPSFLPNTPINNVTAQFEGPTSGFQQSLVDSNALMVARERINLATNNTISFRVPWMSYASMLSNSINPNNGRSNQMASYCNGRVIIVVEPSFWIGTAPNTSSDARFTVAFDVTAGSASQRSGDYVPDLVTFLHDGFRFTKADFNYQLDIIPILQSQNTSCALRVRCHRALGDGGNFYVFQGFPKTLCNFVNDANAIGGAVPTRGNLSRQAKSSWVRDLTADGDVEANPGPTDDNAEPGPSSRPSQWRPEDDHIDKEEASAMGGGKTRISFLERISMYLTNVLGWATSKAIKFVNAFKRQLKQAVKFPGITKISDLVDSVIQLESIAKALEGVKASIDSLNKQLSETRERVSGFINGVRKGDPEIIGDLLTNGVEYVALILNVWQAPSRAMCILNIAALLSKLGLGRFIVDTIVDKCGTEAQGVDETDELSFEYSSIIMAGFMGALGLSALNYKEEGWAKSFAGVARSFFRDGFTIKKFLDSHFKCVSEMIGWLKTKVFGKIEKEGMTEDLLTWVESVHRLTEVYNYDNILSSPEFADRVLSLQDEAFEFDRLFIASRIRPPNTYSIYRARLQKAIDVLGQQGTLMKSKPTPYCVYLYGKSGCGKSHVTDATLIKIGQALGIESADPIYPRSPDVEYWNGYASQKLISWQDFAKITSGETYRKQVSEFSALIEPTPFNPPFAALEDKRKIMDAWAVMVTSNKAFPEVQSIGMTDSALFYRRRHALVQMRLNPAIVDELQAMGIQVLHRVASQEVYLLNKIPTEMFEERGLYFHVQFGFHENGVSTTEPTEWLDVNQFWARVCDGAVEHRTREIVAAQSRRNLYSSLSDAAPTGFEFRQGVKTAREEIERFRAARTVTAAGKDKALKNLGITVDSNRVNVVDAYLDKGTTHMRIKSEVKDRFECSCDVKQVDGEFIREFCAYCEGRSDIKYKANDYKRPVEAEAVRGDVVYTKYVPGSRPMVGLGRRTMLDLACKLYNWKQGTGLPEGYGYWSECMPVCCHNKDVMQTAYFELINDSIEVVIDVGHLSGVRDYTAPGLPTRGRKLVLPAICEQSKFAWVHSVHTSVGELEIPPHTIPVEMQLRNSWSCSATTKPDVKWYLLEPEMLRVLIRGTYVECNDKTTMVSLLNSLLGAHSLRVTEFLNTYFYWRLESMSRCARWFPSVNACYKDVKHVLIQVFGLLTLVLAAYRLYKLVRSSSEMTQVTAEGASQSGDVRKTPSSPAPKTHFVQAEPQVATAQGEEKLLVIQRSLCKLTKGTMFMYGVRLCNTFVLAPLHLTWAQGDFTVSVQNGSAWSEPITYPSGSVKYSFVPGYDYCVLNFMQIPAARNIVNYFCSQSQAGTIRSRSLLVTLQELSLSTVDINIQHYLRVMEYDNERFNKPRVTMAGWQYHLGARGVKCGSLIVSNDMICGMHVAQDHQNGEAYAIGISKEMMVSCLKQLGATQYDMKLKRVLVETVAGETRMRPSDDAKFVLVGRTEDPVHYSGKTNLVKSIVHGEVSEPFRFPAAQKATATGALVGYDIVMKGCEKQFKPPVPIHPDMVEKIGDYLIERIIPNSPPIVPTMPEPVSLAKAIVGMDGVPLMGSMKLDTSIGWPLCNKFPNGSKKHDIIKVDRDRGEVSVHAELASEYDAYNYGRSKGICAPSVFMDFPKDELLKPGKDTRLINGAPLHHTLDMRRYLMEFFAAITKLENKIAVGIDVHSTDWIRVHAGRDDVVDEDYSGFGPGFHSEWLHVACRLAIAWCREYKKVDEEYEQVVTCLFSELKNAQHVAGDLVYEVFCGSPSGAFATDRINSIANLCYHCYCYLEKYGTLTGFWSHYCLVYGDDTRRSETAYSGDEFQQCMESIGIVVKRDKSGSTSFLKRHFVPCRYNGLDVMLAPLPIPIVGDILNWVRRPVFDEIEAVRESVDSYLSEIFHHGRTVYNNSRSKIQELLKRHGRNPELPTFDDLFRQKYGGSPLWPVCAVATECGPLLGLPKAKSD